MDRQTDRLTYEGSERQAIGLFASRNRSHDQAPVRIVVGRKIDIKAIHFVQHDNEHVSPIFITFL